MEWQETWQSPFADFLTAFASLIGDRRTAATFAAILYGLIASGSTLCTRIAAHAPLLAPAQRRGQRVIRFCLGASTHRSQLDAAHLTARLRERAVAHLAPSPGDELWLIVDGSDLRKPYARKLPYLQKVRTLDERLVPGYPTLTVLGVTAGRRGVLYHRLFSSAEPGFQSEPAEVQQALRTVSAALAPLKATRAVTWIMDSRYDDVAVWSTIWAQGEHLLCRVMHPDRRVRYRDRQGRGQDGDVAAAAGQGRRLGTVTTDLTIRLTGQPTAKRQAVTAHLSASALTLTYRPTDRQQAPGPAQRRPLWLLEVRLAESSWEPWLLLTDWPIRTAEEARRVFTMYRQRWSVEDAFKFSKECIDWEAVQVLDLGAIRTLVALAWVATGFLYELGVSWEWEEVALLARLGGYEEHKDRQPGKQVLTRGLGRLLDGLVLEAQLAAHEAEHGRLPPRIAALLGRAHDPPEL